MNQFIKMVLEAQGWDMGRKKAAEARKCVHTIHQTHMQKWSDKTCKKFKKKN